MRRKERGAYGKTKAVLSRPYCRPGDEAGETGKGKGFHSILESKKRKKRREGQKGERKVSGWVVNQRGVRSLGGNRTSDGGGGGIPMPENKSGKRGGI